ncbi:hypothetical protein ACFQ60_03960 [Streptomyces zhihengii]
MLYAAIAAHKDHDFPDAEAALTGSLEEAELLLRTLKGRDRTPLQEPLHAFAELTREFLGRTRATLSLRDAENDIAHRVEAWSRAEMEMFIREWAANNQPIIEAIRRGDEDAFRTLITEESTQLDAPPTTGSAPDPLPETGTLVPDAWAPWPDELAALADAANRDTDLRLRLGAATVRTRTISSPPGPSTTPRTPGPPPCSRSTSTRTPPPATCCTRTCAASSPLVSPQPSPWNRRQPSCRSRPPLPARN